MTKEETISFQPDNYRNPFVQNHLKLARLESPSFPPPSPTLAIAGNNSNFHQQRIQSTETNVRVVWQKLKRIKRKTRENLGRYSRPNWHLRSDRRGGSAVEVNWGLDGRTSGVECQQSSSKGWRGLFVSRRGGRKKKGGKRRKEGKKRRRKVEAHYRWACVSKLPKADLKEGKKKKRRSHVSLQSANIENVFRHCGVARARVVSTLPTNCDYLTEIATGWIHRFARIIRARN